MLEVRTRVAPVKLEPEDVPVVLSRLSASGWEPAILQSEKYFARLAGVEDALDISDLRRRVNRYANPYPGDVAGDVFFRGSDIYYIAANHGSGEYLVEDDEGRIIREDSEPSLEIGIISLSLINIEERLDSFASAAEAATKSALDGRTTGNVEFTWRDDRPATPRLDRLSRASEEESQATFVRAALDDKQISAAETLRPKLTREILIELSGARFARERDVLSKRSKLEQKVKEAINDLKKKGS